MRPLITFLIHFLSAGLFAQEVLTADEAVRMAVEKNYGIRLARLDAQGAELRNTPGQAGMLPDLDAVGAHDLAAEALGITAHRLKALGLIDKIVNEPVGGAHRDHKQMAAFLKRALNDAYRQVSDLKVKELLDRRYERLQSYGRFTDTRAER